MTMILPFAPKTFTFFFFFWALLLHVIVLGVRKPLITGCYLPGPGVIRVTISRSLPQAHSYDLYTQRRPDGSLSIRNSKLVSESDAHMVYDLTGIPKEKAIYRILVRAADIDGVYLDRFFSAFDLVSVPSPQSAPSTPSPFCPTTATERSTTTTTTTTAAATTTITTITRKRETTRSPHPTSSAVVSRDPMFSSILSTISSTPASSSPTMVVETLPMAIGNTSVGSSTADSDDHHHHHHHSEWIIAIVAVGFILLVVVCIGAMLCVGPGCRTRSNRRTSVRSRTSQEGTLSETLPTHEGEMLPLRSPSSSSSTLPHQHQYQKHKN